MKHKLTALLLSLVLCVSLVGTAFAAETATATRDDNQAKVTQGVRAFIRNADGVTVKDILVGAEGAVTWSEVSDCVRDDGTVRGYILEGGNQVLITITNGHTHNYIIMKDSAGHWTECACGQTTTKQPHNSRGVSESGGVRTYFCSECGYVMRTEPVGGGYFPIGGGSSGGSTGGGGGGGSHGGNANGPSGGLSVSIGGMNHGSVTFSPQNPSKGAQVTLKVRPNAGYTLDSLNVTDSKGAQVNLTKLSETKYTFVMPDTRVIVDAKFSGGSGTEEEIPSSGFYDVPSGYWAAAEISWASVNGVMNGVGGGMFNPGSQVNRQQTWMVLARLAGASPADMAAAREWAMANSVSDGSNPTNPLSRQQLVALLYRYAQLKGYALTGAADLSVYPDHAAVASYAREAMAWAVGNGIVTGTSDGRLNPEGTASRAQFAVIMFRFSQKTAG